MAETIHQTMAEVDGILFHLSKMGHEQVLFCNDAQSGLKAIIAVHNTVLGPALGGTRMWAYQNEHDALRDVLRLSRGMTYKNAISGLALGGGKAVIIGDARTMKSEALFRRFGQFVQSLSGKYITAEDVGISPDDMVHVAKETSHVVGLPGKSGDPSPVTAYGVYMGMKACAKIQFGSDSLAGKRIGVQGVGHVGQYLVKHLTDEGAHVFVTDIHEETLRHVSNTYGAAVVEPTLIYGVDMDIIAGAANNQLADEKRHGKILMERGICYAPDFAINAGGVINCFSEVSGNSLEWSHQKAGEIYQTILTILQRSSAENRPSYELANQMAEERILASGGLNL